MQVIPVTNLVAVHAALQAVAAMSELPDDTMDAFTEAEAKLANDILDAECSTEADVAAKLGLVASMVSASGGANTLEISLLERALADLKDLRARQESFFADAPHED